MSYTIRVRLPAGELEIQGPRSDLNKAIKDLPEILQDVKRVFSATSAGIIPTLEVAPKDNAGPFIERATGLNDAIVKVLSTSWAGVPRKWAEIDQALKQNALNYSRGSITGALAYLVKSGRLRRIPIDGVYGYQIPVKYLASTSVGGERVNTSRTEIRTAPQETSRESKNAGYRGKAETSVVLQEIESKLVPERFFDTGRTTRDVKSELEKRSHMKFQSRKVSQALGNMYDKGQLRRTGTKGEFTYIGNS